MENTVTVEPLKVELRRKTKNSSSWRGFELSTEMDWKIQFAMLKMDIYWFLRTFEYSEVLQIFLFDQKR